ncbi:cysteine--tRNA ligase [Leuconostocaceae bacterium ESL0958]|nr:cysteine--tRNA ligase [Leuconostocaceae bacterium ESL0958]
MLTLYNTYSQQKEPFEPAQPGQITMYLCGPTVYNYIHIGNARSAAAFDTARRYFQYRGYQVHFVSNFTDLGDKVLQQAAKEELTEAALAEKYAQAFAADTAKLNILPADERPRASSYMAPMVTFVAALLDRGMAYEVNGNVYFKTKEFPDYGGLAHQNLAALTENAAGRLQNQEQDEKRDAADFALWKKEERPGVQAWPSPWGPGRPGWHLECSVMIDELFGQTIDIHAGGVDLTFPHHTNERAQSESRYNRPFVRYWLHNGFVNINDEKMSKSLDNFVTVHDLLTAGQDPLVLRYFLSKTHYRRPLSYSQEHLDQAGRELERLLRTARSLAAAKGNQESGSVAFQEQLALLQQRFEAAMDDDLNTENALTVLFDLATMGNKLLDSSDYAQVDVQAARSLLEEWLAIFGVANWQEVALTTTQQELLAERATARAAKDYVRSDAIRDQLAEAGILVRDTAEGQTVEYL